MNYQTISHTYEMSGMIHGNVVDIDKNCICRESNPGRLDGNEVFYHQTKDAQKQIKTKYEADINLVGIIDKYE